MSLPDDLAAAVLLLARRFGAGATLWVVAPRWPAHGRHVAVEFVHPVVVGKRALPAVHIDDPGALRLLPRPGDVVLGIGTADDARDLALPSPSLWVGAGPRPPAGSGDHVLWLDGDPEAAAADGSLVRIYHLLWELAHVVLEHPGLLAEDPTGAGGEDDRAAPAAGSEPTGFLYPFIEADERDPAALLADLAASAGAKIVESARLRAETVGANDAALDRAAAGIGRRAAAGGRLFTFGNGGSATDAELAAGLFRRPPTAIPARSLVDDRAVLTALANDVGFELVFSRQLIAHARPGDVALGFSTSGGSPNVLRAFAAARGRGLLTVAVAGYDGGALATSGDVDHCLVVRSDSVHRIQEAQSALVHDLWARTGGGRTW